MYLLPTPFIGCEQIYLCTGSDDSIRFVGMFLSFCCYPAGNSINNRRDKDGVQAEPHVAESRRETPRTSVSAWHQGETERETLKVLSDID